jgi:hypothetical protein
MRSGWQILVLVTLALLVALATSASAQLGYPPPTAAAGTIEPGFAIGPVSLDAKLADLYWNFGQPMVQPSGAGPLFRADVMMEVWANPPTVALFHPAENAPAALGTAAGGSATRKGVGVGSGQDRITGTYGQPTAVVSLPSRPKVLIYNALGIAFQIGYDTSSGSYTNAEWVFVFHPGRAGAIWRTP